MKKLFTFFLFFSIIQFINAQGSQITRCGTDQLHEQKMQDPVFAQKFKTIQRLIKDNLEYRNPSCATPLIIPIAIHWNGAITNANMTCLMDIADDQLEVLNEDFGGYNIDIDTYCNHASNCPDEYDPTAITGGTCIQFCIATLDHPAGSGLNDGDYPFTFGQYTFDSGATPWAGYLNFFVSNVVPSGYPSSLLGLAPLFGGNDPDGNGVFIISSAFGGNEYSCTSGTVINNYGNYDLGRTSTHEVGHYFGLNHIFAGCSDGDNITDTPDQSTDNGGSPTINYTTCISTANNSCSTQDFFFNYMDYVNDVSMYMFTSDQSDVLHTSATTGSNHPTNPFKTAATTCETLPTYNPSFPSGCPADDPPESIFSTSNTTPYDFCPLVNNFNFVDESIGFPTSWSWVFSGAGVSPTSSTDQNPTVEVNSTGTLTATLTASNSSGPDLTPATMDYSITMLPPENCSDCGDQYVDSGGSSSNYNNDEDITHTFCSNVGEYLEIDFTTISIEPFAGGIQDAIYVYEGNTAGSTSNADYYIFGSNIYTKTGNTYYSTSSPIVSTGECMSFRFISDASITYPGWVSNITCHTAPSCTDGLQNQDEEFVDCGGTFCTTCPTPCEGFTFYDVGGPSNPTGSDYEQWQMCADTPSDNVIINFTTVDLNPFNNGVLRIYEGSSYNGNNWDYYITGGSIFIPNGSGGLLAYNGTLITSVGQCYSIDFFNGNSGNGWVGDVTCSTPVPLTLTAFNTKTIGNKIQLLWTTHNEINVDKFIIERSNSNNKFNEIGSVDACGNCQNINNYYHNDNLIVEGVMYTYRLKIIDQNGQYVYSDLLQAKIDSYDDTWSIFPNPGRGAFTLRLPDDGTLKNIVLIDKLGRKVFQTNSDKSEFKLSLEHIESGYYHLIIIGNEMSSKPLVILP